MSHRRVMSLVVSLAVVVGVGVMLLAEPGVAATVHSGSLGVQRGGPVARAAGCPSEVPAGECAVDGKTGCPLAGPIAATPPLRCVPIPSSLPQVDTTVGTPPDTRCAANFFVQVKLRPGLVSYEAVWYSTFGLGTRWWSSPGTVFPGRILGIGAYYKVPKGYAAWSASYSDCGAPPPMTYGTAAWGIESRYEVSGRVTDQGAAAPQVKIRASCPSGGTTDTDVHGDYSFFLKRGPCTIAPVVPATEHPSPKQRHLFVDHDFHNQDFALHYLTISGKTTDANGKPIENAEVDIKGPTSGHLRTLKSGSYGPYKVRPGHYTVTVDFKSSVGQRFPLKVKRCTPGTGADHRCDAQLRRRSLIADFRLPRPKLTLGLTPRTVLGDGRGVSAVKIRLTLDGKPVDDQLLTVFGLTGGRRAPVFTSPEQVNGPDGYAQLVRSSFGETPEIGARAGCKSFASIVMFIRQVGDSLTDRQGRLNFEMFVGTNPAGGGPTLDPIGPSVNVSVTDLQDKIPLPGLRQSFATLRVKPFQFLTAPSPEQLRTLAHKHPPPTLTTDEYKDQIALLKWLTSAGVSTEFAPLQPDTRSGEDVIAFGNPAGPFNYLPLAAMSTSDARDIFGNVVALPSGFPTVDSILGQTFHIPNAGIDFYNQGIYPDPSTTAGRNLLSCLHDGDIDPNDALSPP